MIHKFKSLAAANTWQKNHPKHKVSEVAVEATAPAPQATLSDEVLKLAAAQLGIKERPANSNNVKFNTWFYGHPVAGPPYPWCAVFVSWVLSQCGRAFHEASVPNILNEARAKQNGLSILAWSDVPAALKARKVVLACYDWPGESRGTPDHVGFVRDVVDSGNFHAIEGNTASSSNGSQSNGGEVCLKLRPKIDVEGFVLVKPT